VQPEIFEKPPLRAADDRFANVLRRHLTHDYDHVIEMEPEPAARPRSMIMRSKNNPQGYVHTYNPPEYTKYKMELAKKIGELKRIGQIKTDAGYTMVAVTFYLTYPMSTAKKRIIDLAPHFKKPDGDNFLKGLLDAMSDASIFANDSNIADFCVRKCYTIKPNGFIAFSLA
jgi:Holliday junction resolvase RusA-like endonuclease